MGAKMCGQDIYKKLVSEFGDDFVKLILAEKSKGVIKEKFTQFNNESNEIFDDFQAKTNDIVDGKTDELASVFQSAKQSIDSTIPGGISVVERVKGESINQFSGYNKLQSTIEGIREETLQKVDGKRGEVMGELSGKKNEMIHKIEYERPKVPIYEQLPDFAKKELLKKGQQQFKEQVVDNKDKIAAEAASQFDPKSLLSFFSQISPQNPLQNIVSSAFGVLTGNMAEGTQSGGIGGVINTIGGLF